MPTFDYPSFADDLLPLETRLSQQQLQLDIGSRTDLLRSELAPGDEHFDIMVSPYFSGSAIRYGATSFLKLDQRVGAP